MSIFVCQVCGHVEFGAAPEKCPVCYAPKFEQNDQLFEEARQKSGEAEVKHVPAIDVVTKCGLIPENDCTDVMVRIGKTLHPMEEKHHIAFIDCYVDETYSGRTYLTPSVNPATCFHLKSGGKKVTIVEQCNVHGYWMDSAALT